jgi:hypothetical protein
MLTQIRLLIFAALALLSAYAIFFTDWFAPRTVAIFHLNRSLPARAGQGPGRTVLIFGLNRNLRLTEIRVVPLAEYQTNQNTLPLWHLVSDSNSVPVKSFFYGQSIRGLKPAVPGARPQPLTNEVTYLLLATAGKIKGEHQFELK